MNYFYHWPRPEINLETIISPQVKQEEFDKKKFILCHLSARNGGGGECELWYVQKLIKTLEKKLPPDYFIYLYCQKDRFSIYDEVISERVRVFDCELSNLFFVAKYCSAFVGIDSAPRYIPLYFGKPSYLLHRQCPAPFQIHPSLQIRWVIHPEYCFPLHHSTGEVAQTLINSIDNPTHALFPRAKENLNNWIVNRKFI
ncbi:MAG: hypothetical protein WC390_06455 [Sulfurimonas sp.]|jgi:hypothetical protein